MTETLHPESALPPSPGPDERDRQLVAWLHLSAVSAILPASFKIVLPGLAMIVPLILWMLVRNRSRFVSEQGCEVVNFNLTMSFYFVPVAVIWAGKNYALAAACFHGLWMALALTATFQSLAGRNWRYRLVMRLFSNG